jgi:hypothetical protein
MQGNPQGEKAQLRNVKPLILQKFSPWKIFAQTRFARLRSFGGPNGACAGRTQGSGQGAKALFREAKSLNPQTISE